VQVALAALEHQDAGLLPGGAIELGQPERGDRAAESGPDDAHVDPHGRLPVVVRSLDSARW
jgi:hypothetical protein